jgi:hypothetical protein
MREGGFEPPQVLPHKILSSIFDLRSGQVASPHVRNPSISVRLSRQLRRPHATSWRLCGDPVRLMIAQRKFRLGGDGVIRTRRVAAGLPPSRVRLPALQQSGGQPPRSRVREGDRLSLPRRSSRRWAGPVRGSVVLPTASEHQTRSSPSFKSPFCGLIGNHSTARLAEQRGDPQRRSPTRRRRFTPRARVGGEATRGLLFLGKTLQHFLGNHFAARDACAQLLLLETTPIVGTPLGREVEQREGSRALQPHRIKALAGQRERERFQGDN